MAEDSASPMDSPSHAPDEHDPSSNPSAFLAPSDFLPRLPPSTELPGPTSGDAVPTGEPPTAAPKVHVDSQGRTLNPRSCVTCRKRKVKCDKLHPCSNCNRAQIECVFPSPGRAPRKVRKHGEGRDKELLDRLRRLEGVVTKLGVDVGDEVEKAIQTHVPAESRPTLGDSTHTNGGTTAVGNGSSEPVNEPDATFLQKAKWMDDQQQDRFENRFGRLVVNEGKSRYVNNSFWASLSSEVEDLKGILNQSSDDEDAMTPESNQASGNNQGFIFGFSSQSVDLLSLHPIPTQVPVYWAIFKDRVDPLCKVLHIPSLESTVLNAANNLSNLPRGFEALVFAMYYAAVTSLPAHDCLIRFSEEKSVLLTRYQFALEQALARANFLITEEMVVLQAFVIFLICLRRNSDARVIWTLTGLIVRIAQTIGIHRDGSHFGLSPFEIELRRRLWWQVCILDTRASEDHGCDPTIIEQSFDTKLPLNINDADITPESKEFPPERQGCTEMSFCLIRCEVANTFRRINYIPPGPPKPCTQYLTSVTLQDKEKWISECHKRLEDRYLKHCDMSVPLYWVTATVARLMMSKMWLMVYHPFQRLDDGPKLSDETKDKLFITSLENMEYSLLLETESRTMKWGWLFKTYIQWHALAFCLSELCHRTTGDLVERAWKAVEKTRDGRWGIQINDETNTGHLWRPLRKLYRKARDARQRGLQQEEGQQSQRQFANHPRAPVVTTAPTPAPTRTYSPNAHPMFTHSQPHPPPPGPAPGAPLTRAPLSQAQLRRLTEGPAFGHTPLDKHTLLRSSASPSSHASPSDPDGKPRSRSLFATPHTATPAAATASPHPPPRCPAPAFGQNFMGPAPTFDFHDFPPSPPPPLSPPAATAGEQEMVDVGDPEHEPGAGRGGTAGLRVNSFGSADGLADPDLGAAATSMDLSGDLDWEDWDQLARQFGMDVDSSAGASVAAGGGGGGIGSGVSGTMMGWTGPNWEMGSNGANLRMGMGMGGGDWF